MPSSSDDGEARQIHAGSYQLPPLVEVSTGGRLPLAAVIKPPDADTLWQWQQSRGMRDADSSWACVWPAAASLAALLTASPGLVTGKAVVDRIITELGVFDILPAPLPGNLDAGDETPTRLELIEIADGVSIDEVRAATGAPFRIADGYHSRWLIPMLQEPGDLAAMHSGRAKHNPTTVQWQKKRHARGALPPIVDQEVPANSATGRLHVPSEAPAATGKSTSTPGA